MKKIIYSLFLAAAFLGVSCEEQELTSIEEIEEVNGESISLYLVDKDEIITVNSLEEVSSTIQKLYDSESPVVKQAVAKIQFMQNELAISANLNLEDPAIEASYLASVNERLTDNTLLKTESTNGILWDGIATGFLSVSTVPLNLRASKRNRVSSWSPISPGTVILCDNKWFKGQKFVLFAIIPGPTAVVPAGFNNRTDSFF